MHANPDSRKWERGAPVEGVDGKWIGTHRRLPLTISKELKRNRDEFGVYLPTHAHRKSVLRRFRPKRRKIDANPRLRTVVWAMVKDRYSPEQISGRLRSCYPGDETMYVCPETIYQSLYFQAKGELKKEVTAALRRGHAQRRPRGTRSARKRFVDPMVVISDRPAEVDDRGSTRSLGRRPHSRRG